MVRHAVPKKHRVDVGIAEKLRRDGTTHHLGLALLDDPVAALDQTDLTMLVGSTARQLDVDQRLLTERFDRCCEELVVRANNLDSARLPQREIPKFANRQDQIIRRLEHQ